MKRGCCHDNACDHRSHYRLFCFDHCYPLAGRPRPGLDGFEFRRKRPVAFGDQGLLVSDQATTVCAILFLFTCIGLSIFEARKSRSLFQAPATQAPLDVNQIKKALDKVKQTSKPDSAAAAAPTGSAEETAPVAPKADTPKT